MIPGTFNSFQDFFLKVRAKIRGTHKTGKAEHGMCKTVRAEHGTHKTVEAEHGTDETVKAEHNTSKTVKDDFFRTGGVRGGTLRDTWYRFRNLK